MSSVKDALFGSKPKSVQPITPDMQQYIDRYESQVGAANQANEARYQDILALLDRASHQNVRDVQRGGRELEAQTQQDLIGRGLYNTNVWDSLRGNIRTDTRQAMNRERDSLIDRRAGVMERKTDLGPDGAFYAQMLANMGAANQYNASRQRSGGILGNIFGGI